MHVGGDLGRNLDRRIVFPLVEMLTHYVKHYIPRHDACGLDGAYYLLGFLACCALGPARAGARSTVQHDFPPELIISLVFLPVALFGRPAPGRAPPCNLNFLLSFPLVDRLSLLVNVWSPTDDRAHAAVSHVGCARRNARQVLPPSSQLRICAQIPQNRGVFKSTEITNVLDNIK